MKRPDAIWKYDSAGTPAYTDYTDNVKTNASIAFVDATTQYYYIGLSSRFIGIYTDLSTNGAYTTIAYEYYDGISWKKLSLIESYIFASSKYQRWVLPEDWIKYAFTTTVPHAVTPPDTYDLYWIRISASAVTTAAVISKIRCLPFATYSTPSSVSNYLQLKSTFTPSSTPSDLQVSKLIRKAEDIIDYKTRKSWKFNPIVEETQSILVDYNRYGIYTRHRNFYKVYGVYIWNGGAWETLTEGRTNDYFVNYDLGMIYMTRMFLLPAAYGMSGRYFHFGYGEYKNSVKVDYAYGRDIETDTEAYQVNGIVNKIVAAEIYKNSDYNVWITSGADKLPIAEKVHLLQQEIDDEIDSLAGLFIT